MLEENSLNDFTLRYEELLLGYLRLETYILYV